MHAPGDLSRVRREMIAVVVSSLNRCHYCLRHHGAGLLRLTRDESLARKLSADFTQAQGLGPADRAMLEYAAELAMEPWAMSVDHVLRLR